MKWLRLDFKQIQHIIFYPLVAIIFFVDATHKQTAKWYLQQRCQFIVSDFLCIHCHFQMVLFVISIDTSRHHHTLCYALFIRILKYIIFSLVWQMQSLHRTKLQVMHTMFDFCSSSISTVCHLDISNQHFKRIVINHHLFFPCQSHQQRF